MRRVGARQPTLTRCASATPGESNRGAELGTVEHVLILPSLLVVIDGSAPFVKVFGHDGRLVQAFGGPGGGPGEYRGIDAAAYDPASRELWLVDNRLARVSRLAAGDTLRPVSAQRMEVTSITSMCAMNGAMYALSSFGGRFVHELAAEGDRVVARRSWGEPKTARDVSANPGLRNNSANGPIDCDGARGVVYAGATLYGEVHRVDTRTGAHTFTPIAEFVGMEFRPAGGGVSMAMPARGWVERIVSVRAAASGVEVVLAASPPGAGRSPYAVLTMPDGGATSARAGHTWRPIGRAGAHVVCSTDDPAPTVAFFAGSRCP